MSDYAFLEERTRPDAPLLFTFHGTGGSERQFAGIAAELLPEAGHIAPRGDVSELGALRFFRRTTEGVYDMADLASRTGKMAGFVASQKARLGASRVIGMGYSNGANILAAVAFHAPGLFDDLVLMHPLIPFRPAPAALGGTRALITAGERDPICPTPLTEALAGCLREDGAEVLVHWHPGGHEIRPQEFEAASAFLRAAPAAASLAGRPVSGFARGPGGT